MSRTTIAIILNPAMAKKCEKICPDCSERAIQGERYCPECRDAMLRRMEDEGYLQPIDEIERNDAEEPRSCQQKH